MSKPLAYHLLMPLGLVFFILPNLSAAQSLAGSCRLLKSTEESEQLLLTQLAEASGKYDALAAEFRVLLSRQDATTTSTDKEGGDWDAKALHEAAELLAADPAIMAFKRQEVVNSGFNKLFAQRRLVEFRLLMERGRLQNELQQTEESSKRFDIQKQIAIVADLIEKNCRLAQQDAEIADLEQFYVLDPADRVDSAWTPSIRAALAGAQVWYFGTKRLPKEWRWYRQYRKFKANNRFLSGQDKDFRLALANSAEAVLTLRQKQQILTALQSFWTEVRDTATWQTPAEGATVETQARERLKIFLSREFGANLPSPQLLETVLNDSGFIDGAEKIGAALRDTPETLGERLRILATEQATPIAIMHHDADKALQLAERPPSANHYFERLAQIDAEKTLIRSKLTEVINPDTKDGLLDRLRVLERERKFIDNVIGKPGFFRRGYHNLGVVAHHSLLAFDVVAIAQGALIFGNDLNLAYHLLFGDEADEDPANQPQDQGLELDAGAMQNYADVYWNYQKDDDGVWKYWEISEPLRMPYIVASLSELGNRQISIARLDQNIAKGRENLPIGKRDWLKIEVPLLFDPSSYVRVESK